MVSWSNGSSGGTSPFPHGHKGDHHVPQTPRRAGKPESADHHHADHAGHHQFAREQCRDRCRPTAPGQSAPAFQLLTPSGDVAPP